MTPSGGDDAPIFDEHPRLAIEFAPRVLRPPGRRGPLAAGAWAIAVVSLVAIGLLTGEPEGADTTDSLAGGGPPLAGDGPSLSQVIDVESPTHRRVVQTRQVEVRGSILGRADHVEIALEARGNRALERVRVDVFDPDGGIRPAQSPTFEAAFDLPLPRPNGTMWIVVTAYDDRGMPLASTRRPFTIGALVEVEAVPVPSTRGLDGNWPWRPYVERPPIAAPLPTCLPASTTLHSKC